MKLYLFVYSILILTSIASAQPKTKNAVMANTTALKKLMSGTGLPFTMANDSLAVIPYEGENIESYQVIVQRISDLFIIHINLTKALPGKINETTYKYLLQTNDHYDVVKTGVGTDNTVYLKVDIYESVITAVLLTKIIKQVANVTNIIAGELK